MSKVYFSKNFKGLGKMTRNLLKDFYPANSKVAVKIHFGESGNRFAFFAADVKPIIEALKSLKLRPFFIDTPVAYHSPRNSIKGYKNVVKERGYNKLAPSVISNRAIKIKTKDFTAGVCRDLVEAKNVLVISHVKGHYCSGFGGAIKNLGMGGVTKETKKIEHALAKPHFIAECQGCGICVGLCPAGAIKMVKKKAVINLKECWGCSICQLECPHKCLAPQKALFDDLLAQGAAAVINRLPGRTFYINFVKNITRYCDCEQNPGNLISKDVGLFFSDNPVAIDKASVDLINKINKRNVFKFYNHKDPLLQLNFASQYTGRELNYKKIVLNHTRTFVP